MHFSTDMDLVSLLESRKDNYQDKPLYSFLDRNLNVVLTLSYSDVYQSAVRIAAALQAHSLNGQPVVLLYSHGPDFIKAFFGCIFAGAWPMPITKARGENWATLSDLVSISGAKALLTTQKKAGNLPEQLRHLIILCTDCTANLSADWVRPEINSDDIALIQYTSGSTSNPRGVLISHGNVLHNSKRICRNFSCTNIDIGVSWLPFHHDMGLIGHIVQPLYAGFHNYFLAPIDFLASPLRWLQAISTFKGTVSGGPNFAYALIAMKVQDAELAGLDLGSWRLAYCGSEKVVPESIMQFELHTRKYGFSSDAFYSCYGMAESTLFVCGLHGLAVQSEPESGQVCPAVGKIDSDGTVVIVDTHNGRRVPDGQTGEIWLNSPSVSKGYFSNADATVVSFNQTLDGNSNYMRTGDIGFIKENTLYFAGRIKNLIKRRGRSFFAEDIEEKVVSEFRYSGVSRCAAFEAQSDGEESLVILLECQNTQQPEVVRALPNQVKAFLCDDFSILPGDVVTVPRNSLPLTTSGKLQRNKCREFYVKELKRVLMSEENRKRDALSEYT
jgi:acyl-CoA synthetase (AMP-forming)/AMP-acid ligase II